MIGMTMRKRWLCALLGAALLLTFGASWAQEDYIVRTQRAYSEPRVMEPQVAADIAAWLTTL